MSNRPLDYQLNTALVESRFSFSRLLIDPTLVICLLILSIYEILLVQGTHSISLMGTNLFHGEHHKQF